MKKAYELAFNLVTKYGMSENLGNVGFVDKDYNKVYSSYTNKVHKIYLYLFITNNNS